LVFEQIFSPEDEKNGTIERQRQKLAEQCGVPVKIEKKEVVENVKGEKKIKVRFVVQEPEVKNPAR
jgi:hypothetical protein